MFVRIAKLVYDIGNLPFLSFFSLTKYIVKFGMKKYAHNIIFKMKKIPFIAKITRHTLVKIKMNMKSLMREFIM